jgi:D-alanyl-lipoteichoic acid acyltransferase DltB (MBOAT superfamily)
VLCFFKLNVVAMLFHALHEDALTQMLRPSPLNSKLFCAFQIFTLYPLFLYSNFSGYIDIVIALARLMRVRLPENFDRPFSASSVLEFWNRWHMTLSNWFKVYVYNPLLLALMRRVSSSAVQPLLAVVCFFVTFFLMGVWHGRTSEFVVFGVLNGLGISINKLWQIWLTRLKGRKGYTALARNETYTAFGRGLNFSWYAFTMFWFWGTWKQIDSIFDSLTSLQWLLVWMAIWLISTAVLEFWERLRSALLSVTTVDGPVLTSRYARVVYATAMGVFCFLVAILLNQPAPTIVYKGF